MRAINLNFLQSISPSTKFISVIILLGYILSFSEKAVNALSVIPGNLLPPQFFIWTAFTFCFLEIHFYEVIIDIITVALCGKLMEPLWDQMKMMTFFAVVNVGVAVLSSIYYLLLFAITKNTEILFNIKIHGLIGFLAGLSVSVMLVMPDLLIARTPFGNFTNRNIPLTFMILSIILWALNLASGTPPVMFCSGLLTSFVYLRFYQRQTNGTRGTSAENFTFASFFPSIMQPVIRLLVNPIYKVSLSVGLIKHNPIIPLSHSNSDIRSLTMSMAGSTSEQQHDNERRRQIALKALNERWKALNTDPTKTSALPKSFPQSAAGSSGSGTAKSQHQHGGGFLSGIMGHGHSHERKVIPKFDIDEIMKPIALPMPPGMQIPSSIDVSHSAATNLTLNKSSSSTNLLINMESETSTLD